MKILLADDHGLFRDSMAIWLGKLHLDVQTHCVSDLAAATAVLATNNIELLLLDLYMPGMDGAASVKMLCAQYTQCKIVVVSAEESVDVIYHCIEAGANGYIPKALSGTQVLEALSQIIDGKIYTPDTYKQLDKNIDRGLINLNKKQLKILTLVGQGHSNKEIGEQMFLSEGTIKQYITKLIRILEVENRIQASIKARKVFGILPY